MSCPYKDIFGKPNEGAHKYKLFGISIVDTVLTIILALIISKIFKWNFWVVFTIVFIIGEILHYLFCVDTAVIKFLKGK